ncbi:hypothetical protein [Nocardioides xinjiangensis]|uniref:hypothetical protein n=1 Tax=Nocardioides xinjiangensis TaxID=2817376 RepID=UPI001B304E89|nr:hypothetical protein [Nocardioides sp. SYSU D00778]
MPINPFVRSRNTSTGGSKMTPGDQIVALFGFIGLHELRNVFLPAESLPSESLPAESDASGDITSTPTADSDCNSESTPAQRRGRKAATHRWRSSPSSPPVAAPDR